MSGKQSFRHLILFIGSITLALAFAIGTTPLNFDVAQAVTCANPRTLAVEGSLMQSASWRTLNAEWINFQVQKDSRYILQVSGADGLELAVYESCDASGSSEPLRNGQIEFTATRDGEYYLLVKHDGVSAAGLSGYQATLAPAAPIRPNTIEAQNVPEGVLRRATDFLEELRGSNLAPEWVDARINPIIGVFYRPDVQGVAYYEATVEKPVVGGYAPAGYIQLSAGDFDYPIINWNMTGTSTAKELAELAPLGAQLTDIYRLNSGSYAAEYTVLGSIGLSVMATEVINLGDLPNKIAGLDTIPEKPFDLVTQTLDSDGTSKYEGPAELPLLEQTPWDSWAALKAGYTTEYAPLNKSLKERASERWTTENKLTQYGETLIKGNVRKITGLAGLTLASIQVTGDGAAAQYLKQEPTFNGAIPTGVTLTVLDEPANLQTLLPIVLTLTYTSGAPETVKFAIANHEALVTNTVYLPLITKTGAQQDLPAAADETAVNAPTWGPWHYYWADGDAGSIRYNQIPAHTGVNTSGCYSGCGATAWMMEFGWVDRRAAENHPTWRYHWGLYRVNGSVAGANAVAPLIQDSGVNNATWEIRNYLGTHCSGTGGSTYYTDMINAWHYVAPRATTGWRMSTRYDPTGLCWFGACNGARDLAVYQIVNRHAPAILGGNNHFPMAYGYAWQSEEHCFLWWCSTDYNRWFYVNQGWGGSGNGWFDYDDVSFAGIYYPY